MKRRDHHYPEKLEHRPGLSIGLFFVLLGVSLLAATNDIFHLGSLSNYFTWQTALIFIGLLLLLNLRFTGGLLMIAGGIWFLIEDYTISAPEIVRTLYWPVVIVVLGLSFIISSFFKKKN